MRALLLVLGSLALAGAGGLSGAASPSGAGSASEACPAGCDCGVSDGEDEFMCRAGNFSFTVKGRSNDYARIICTGGDLDAELMPRIPFSANGTLASLTVQDCALTSSLASMLASVGARRATSVALNGHKGLLTARWTAGVEGIEALIILGAEDQTRVPWDVVDALPALKDFRLRQSNLSLEDPADPLKASVPVHPSLESVELSLDQLRRLPPGARARLRAVTKLYLWGNDIRNVTNETLAGLEALQVLDLSRNPLQELPARALASAPALQRLTLVAAGLRAVRTGAFGGLEHLEQITLKFCQTLQLEPRALAALPALKVLDLNTCPLEALPADLLLGSEALEVLTITKSKLEALPAGLFQDQGRLRQLNLQENRISSLPPNLFWPLHALTELNLDDNQIEELPDQLLSGLTELKSLSCERNGLRLVAPAALQGAAGLQRVSLAENKLSFEPQEDSGMSSYMAVLGHQSPFQFLMELKVLVLRHNSVRSVFSDWMWQLLQLQELDLSYNQIDNLTRADLQFLAQNLTVDMRHNHISSVQLLDAPAGEAASTPAGRVLLLDDNPFSCDCNLYGFLRRLQGASYPLAAEPRLDPGGARCVSPPSLAGRPLRSVSADLLTCPLKDDDCPHNCTCLFRPSILALELDCYEEPAEYPNLQDIGVTQTHLRLRHVSSLKLPAHVTVLNLTGAGLEEAPALQELSNVRELDLSSNNLTSAPLELLHSNLTLRLSGNRFICDCSHVDSVTAMQKLADKITDSRDVTCSGGEPVWTVDAARLCDIRHAVLLGGTLAILGLIAAVAAALTYRYILEIKLFLFSRGWCGSWTIAEEFDKGAQYDAFVSFSQEDARWVAEKLVPVLEDQYHFKLCIHYRDWIVGDMIPAQIARSVEESRRTIVVLSKSFLSSTWALLEFRAANQRAQIERRARVLVLVLDDAPELADMDAELRAYLNTNTYLKWGDPWFWEKLRYAMPRKKTSLKAMFAQPEKLKKGGLDARLTADGKIVNEGSLSAIVKL